MIRFALRCAKEHAFESWFASNAAYEALREKGHVGCPVCGDTSVEKALMAPAVSQATVPAVRDRKPMPPNPEIAAKLEALRRHVEANSDYVGMKFASEARAMHLGDAPTHLNGQRQHVSGACETDAS